MIERNERKVFFLNLEISQVERSICELSLTLTSLCLVQEGKSHSCCQHLDISARSDFLVFLTPLMGRAGSCWTRVQKAWICLLVASSLPSPALPSILQTLGFSPLLLWNRLGSCWRLWLISVYLVCPSVGGRVTLEKKYAGLLCIPPPLPFAPLGGCCLHLMSCQYQEAQSLHKLF